MGTLFFYVFTKFFEILYFFLKDFYHKKWSGEGLSYYAVIVHSAQCLDYQINIGSYFLWAPFILSSIILC
jgi:hypothetical protein